MPKWKCYKCEQVYDQETPPEICTNCNAQVSFWIDWTEAKTPLDEPVSKYMTRELSTIDINASAWDAAKLMRERKVGSVLIALDGKPVGIVTERDMLYKIVAEDLPASHVLLRKIMSSPLVSITEDTPVKTAIRIMEEKRFRRLLITKGDEAIGIVNQSDLVEDALKTPLEIRKADQFNRI